MYKTVLFLAALLLSGAAAAQSGYPARPITSVVGFAPGGGTDTKQGLEAAPSTPEDLGAYIKREYETWAKVVKEAGIKAP